MLVIYVLNDRTAVEPLGNYTYQVSVNARKIAAGAVKGHKLEDGWLKLLAMILEQETNTMPAGVKT